MYGLMWRGKMTAEVERLGQGVAVASLPVN
jgi:hypothetical protein